MRVFPVPTKRLIKLLLIPLFLLIMGIFNSFFLKTGLVVNLLLFFCMLYDGLSLLKTGRFIFSSDISAPFSLLKEGEVKMNIEYKGTHPVYLELMWDLPPFVQMISGGERVMLESGKPGMTSFVFKALRRGVYTFNKLNYRYRSTLDLFYIYSSDTLKMELEVAPEFKELKQYLTMGRLNRLNEIGIHKNRLRGLGTEFESLREYTKDDNSRFIDWKASARLNRPVVKNFQMERQNNITLVLDCGRLMTGEEEGLSSLDYSINASLLLAYIALAMGDTLRIIAFSDKIKGDSLALGGQHALKKVVKFVTPLQADLSESNYRMLFSYLRTHVKKRSLVIFVSDIIDDINYELFKKNFSSLSKRHALLYLLIRDTVLDKEASGEIRTSDDLFPLAAARSMSLKRHQVITKLKHQGVDVLDVLPKEVSGSLINNYLTLKAKNRI